MHITYDVMGDQCLRPRRRSRRTLLRLRRSSRKGLPRVPHLDVERLGMAWAGACVHTHIPQHSICIAHMATAHGVAPDAQRTGRLLISSEDAVLCVHATDGCHGTHTHRLTSSFGEFIVMPPYDSTREIRPVGRIDTMHTTDWYTTHISHVGSESMYTVDVSASEM